MRGWTNSGPYYKGDMAAYTRQCGCRLLEAVQMSDPGCPWYGRVYDPDEGQHSGAYIRSPLPGFHSREEAMRWAEDALRQECEETLRALESPPDVEEAFIQVMDEDDLTWEMERGR